MTLRRRRTPFKGPYLPRRNPGVKIPRGADAVYLLFSPTSHPELPYRISFGVGGLRNIRIHWFRTEAEALEFVKKTGLPLKQDNPQNYAYGPTGFRPPKKWFDKMLSRAKETYRPRKGQSQASYRAQLARVVGGIWSRFSDSTRREILKKYEPAAAKGLKNPRQWHAPVDPSCPKVRKFVRTLLGDPMTKAIGAPVGEIIEDFEREHIRECRRCREYGLANIEVRNPGAAWHKKVGESVKFEGEYWEGYKSAHRESEISSEMLGLPNPLQGFCPLHGNQIALNPAAKQIRCPGGHTLTNPLRKGIKRAGKLTLYWSEQLKKWVTIPATRRV